MYKEIKTVKTGSKVKKTNQGVFVIKRSENRKEIVLFGRNGNESKKFESINMDGNCRVVITNDYLLISLTHGTTIFYSIEKETEYILNKQLTLAQVNEDHIYIYIYSQEHFYRFNKIENCIDYSVDVDKSQMLVCILEKYLAFKLHRHKLLVYKNNFDGLDLSWQLTVSALFIYSDATIQEVHPYYNSFIVVTTSGIAKLDVNDGSVIWKADGYAATLEIVDNIGYICTGLSFLRINLDTGEESGYGWEHHRLPDFFYNGQKYKPAGHKAVYHEGLLWYSVYSSGHSFLLAINPENGNYEWIHHVDTYEKTEAPQFYEDKMFLWDTGNTLHIYEKE